MNNKFSRRDFLKLLAILSGGGGILLTKFFSENMSKGLANYFSQSQYLPMVLKDSEPISSSTAEPSLTTTTTPETTPSSTPTPSNTPPPPPTGSRVVHIHSLQATTWDGSDTQYWNYVDQSVVNNMVDQGLMALTGATTVAGAWQILLPNYLPGQGIAIKVNFNNAQTCGDTDSQIDAIVQPVNSVIRGLKQIGVSEDDIWIYDAIRSVPDRFVNACQYNGVRFFGGCRISAGFSSTDPYSVVTFSPPEGVPPPSVPIKITDVLINARYLINVPIMKAHGYTGTTLAFKNHFGAINRPDLLHTYLHGGSNFRQDYSPLVDVYKNPHVVEKTILTIGDGLFGCPVSNILPPRTWSTFNNNVPNSLFFATDPVAIDCVMTDFIYAEWPGIPDPNYLPLAGAAGLGVYERGDPWGVGYNQIEYLRIDF